MSAHDFTVVLFIKQNHPHHDDIWTEHADGSVEVQWRGQPVRDVHDKRINSRSDIMVFVKKRHNHFYTYFGRVSVVEQTQCRIKKCDITGRHPKGPLYVLAIEDFKDADTDHCVRPKKAGRQYRFRQACYSYLWGSEAPSCSHKTESGVHVWSTAELPPLLDDVV